MSPAELELERQRLLAELLADEGFDAGVDDAIVPQQRTEARLSYAQELLWLVEGLHPGIALSNVPVAFDLEGDLHVDVLQDAVSDLVRRHAALRTRFVERDGAPLQLVQNEAEVPFTIVDLRGVAESEREAEAEGRMKSEMRAPFAFDHAPLMRGMLLRLGDQRWRFLLTQHHLVCDGLSLERQVAELSADYNARRAHGSSAVQAPALEFTDFAEWQRERTESGALAGEVQFWRDRLKGAADVLELPTDRPRAAIREFNGDDVAVVFPAALMDRVWAFGQSHGVTPFMTLFAAYQALLSRYSGQDDFVIGTPVSGRTRTEMEGVIGYFANMIPLRTDLGGDPSFEQLLRRVSSSTLEAFEHQDVPFERLVQELGHTTSSAHTPLFQTMFSLATDALPEMDLAGLRVRRLHRHIGWSTFDLWLYARPTAEGLRVAVEYRTDLFEAATIRRMLGHLRVLIEEAIANPQRPMSRLPIITRGERDQILGAFNDTATPFPHAESIHALFEAQVARTPDAIAVQDDSSALTFVELDARANQLARHLETLGVTRGQLVGLAVQRSVEMMVALLGVMKSGAAYVPLDPDYPADRLAFMLKDSGARVMVTQESVRMRMPAFDGTVVSLDADADLIARSSKALLGARVTAEDLAYVIYTSGSTGIPKGAMLPHRAVVNYLQWMQSRCDLTVRDCVLQKAPVSFDASVWELYLPLITGARLFLARPDGHRDPAYLLGSIVARGVTIVQFVPSLLGVVLEPFAETCSDVRLLVLGGEALPGELAARLRVLRPSLAVENLYGPTECAVYATAWTLPENFSGGAVPIGTPIANDRVYILGRGTSELSPVGIPGELCIAGRGVGAGYHNRPELTAAHFVPDPFVASDRMYRTGDLARWRPDGVIEFLGRIDHQVKVRGFRVELGEIETALAGLHGVRECVVVQRGEALVGYVVAEQGRTLDAADLRTAMRKDLPDYMVPSAIVVLDAMPLNANGKLDRKALPDPGTLAEAREYVAPRTALETLIAETWAEVLKLPRVGVNDDFFEMGGHSLLGMRILARLASQLGRPLSLRHLFDGRTVAGLAERIDAEAPPASAVQPIARVASNEAPASFAQELLWLVEQMTSGQSGYGGPELLRVRGDLDVAALGLALNDVVAHQDSLSTEFFVRDGAVLQRVVANARVPLTQLDFRNTATSPREAAMTAIQAEIQRDMDLTHAPIYRAVVARVADAEWILGLFTHHIVTDDLSRAIIFRELAVAYNARRLGETHVFAPLPVRFRDFAAWQRSRLNGKELDKRMAYWRSQLDGVPEVLELATDKPRPPVRTFGGSRVRVVWPRELLDAAKQLGSVHGTTLFMTILAAFEVVLARHSGQDDFVVGSPVAGRPRAELDEVVGYFANMLALRADLRGAPTFAELLARVRTTALGAYEHDDTPFEALVGELKHGVQPSHAPIFQTMFAMLDPVGLKPELGEAQVELLALDAPWSRYDLWLTCRELTQGLHAELEYRTDLFETDTAQRILAHVGEVLAAAARNTDVPVTRLAMLPAAERRTLLESWNATQVAFEPAQNIHSLFEAQVDRTPDAVAVEDERDALTYAELDARANQLADHLRARGVERGALVGLAVDRSVSMMVALLGVMKAGAAYVPLDPDYPADRLTFMLKDSGARVLVTEEAIRGRFPDFDGTIVCLDADRAVLAAASAARTAVSGATPEDLAYVIYTSGSTGIPKGAMLPHRAVVNYLQWMQSAYALTAHDCVIQKAPVSFDASVWELYLPLISGARLFLARPGGHRDPAYLLGAIAAHRVTVVQFVPSLLALLLEPFADACPDVRLLVLGGEALPAELAARIRTLLPTLTVENLYGPTECAVYATRWTLPPQFSGGIVPIGTPIANDRIYILGRGTAELVPIGVPGELCIAGRGVGAGYHNRPDLTAAHFVRDPFVAGDMMYRTGDLARWRSDGVIEFLGRIDHQVKVRGFRVELGEIETALAAHPDVNESVVIARNDALVGYVVPVKGASIDISVLRAALRATLPDYMVPNVIVPLEAMPLNANGKLDRKALPEPEAFALVRDFVHPRTPSESMIAELWADVLGREKVGVEDDFFDLGGHSLLGMRILARLSAALGRNVPLRLLFDTRTVAALARAIDDEAAEAERKQMEQLLAELESVSEEEAMRLLASNPDTQISS